MKIFYLFFLLLTFEHFADLIRRDGFVHIFFSRIGKICNEMKTITVAISIVYWYFIVYLYCYILNAFKMFKMFRMHLNVYKEQKNCLSVLNPFFFLILIVGIVKILYFKFLVETLLQKLIIAYITTTYYREFVLKHVYEWVIPYRRVVHLCLPKILLRILRIGLL